MHQAQGLPSPYAIIVKCIVYHEAQRTEDSSSMLVEHRAIYGRVDSTMQMLRYYTKIN